MSELEKVKIWIGIEGSDEDSLIVVLLEDAQEIIQGLSKTPKDYGYLKREAVVYAYNQRGAEGNRSTSSGGFSQSWYYETMSKFIKNNMPNPWVIK